MTCEELQPLIGAYHDGELDAVASREVENHILFCERCRAEMANDRALSDGIRLAYQSETASDRFANRVRNATVGKKTRAFTWPWAMVSGSLAGAMAVLLIWHPWAVSQMLGEVLISGHVRSMMMASPVEVVSSDRHTVKPWFQGKLDFSPEVYDLKSEGFPLIGGRLDVLDGRPVAALVFRKDKHLVNLFVSHGMGASTDLDEHGFHVRHFRLRDLDYWLVSDVSPSTLESFENMYISESNRQGS